MRRANIDVRTFPVVIPFYGLDRWSAINPINASLNEYL